MGCDIKRNLKRIQVKKRGEMYMNPEIEVTILADDRLAQALLFSGFCLNGMKSKNARVFLNPF